MTGLISQNRPPYFAAYLLSFQLLSLYSLISLRYLRKEADIHSDPAGDQKQKYVYLRKKRNKRMKLIRKALACEIR